MYAVQRLVSPKNFCKYLRSKLSERYIKTKKGDRRASVALIMRYKKPKQWKGSLKDQVEMLFILRASLKDDRWSGQVGFPGGHVEKDETDEEAAVRECKEEIGLNLGEKVKYESIGKLNEWRISTKDRKSGKPATLILNCHIFFQTIHEDAYHLSKNELQACGWAPLSSLTSNEFIEPLNWGTHWEGMPSVHLPMENLAIVANRSHERIQDDFKLWGLTLMMVNDFLLYYELRKKPIELSAIRHRL